MLYLCIKLRCTQASHPFSVSHHLFLHKYHLENCSDDHLFAGWIQKCLGRQGEGQAVNEATISFCHFESQWEKKIRQRFDRWNWAQLNSCQLRLQQKLKFIPFGVQNVFWPNHNFRVKQFSYIQLQGCSLSCLKVKTITSHSELHYSFVAMTVFKYDFRDEASTERLHSPVPQMHLVTDGKRNYRFLSQCSQKCCLL